MKPTGYRLITDCGCGVLEAECQQIIAQDRTLGGFIAKLLLVSGEGLLPSLAYLKTARWEIEIDGKWTLCDDLPLPSREEKV